MAKSKHPKYKQMIIETLKSLNSTPFARSSRHAISEHLLSTFKLDRNHHFKRNLRLSLYRLEDQGVLVRVKQSFRLAAGVLARKRRRIVKRKRNIKKATKKAVRTLKPATKKSKKNSNGKKASSKKATTKRVKKVAKPKKANAAPKKRAVKKTSKASTPPATTSPTKSTKQAKVNRAIKQTLALNQPIPSSMSSIVNKQINSELKEKKAVWQFYDANNQNAVVKSPDHWYDYDPKASAIVEEEWQKYIKNRAMCDVRAVKSGQWHYQVDFINWSQQNIDHSAHTKRRIRRLDENGQITKNPYQ